MLEILIALAVLGILVAGLTQSSRFVLLGRDQQTWLLAGKEDLDAVDRALRHLIEQAKPGSEWEPLIFSGTAHSVGFTSVVPLPANSTPSNRADIELSVDAAHRLLLTWKTHLHAVRTGPPPQTHTAEILEGVERLDLAYTPAASGGGWTQVWRAAEPPRLVRIRIVFSDPSHPRWPDILAAPRMDPP